MVRPDVKLRVSVADRGDESRQFQHDRLRFHPVDAVNQLVQMAMERILGDRMEEIAVDLWCLDSQVLDILDPLRRRQAAKGRRLVGERRSERGDS